MQDSKKKLIEAIEYSGIVINGGRPSSMVANPTNAGVKDQSDNFEVFDRRAAIWWVHWKVAQEK